MKNNTTNTNKKYYVTMSDTFMSGWGEAQGKTSKYILECDTYEEAQIVLDNAKNRSEMKRATICVHKPRYNKTHYVAHYTNKEGSPNWYTPNYFGKQKARGLC